MLVTLCYKANGSCFGTHHTFGIQPTFYLAYTLGTLITVLRNLLVIVIILRFKALHTFMNLPRCSLALAHLLLGLTMLLFSTNRSVKSCWCFGDDFCRLHTLFRLTSAFHLYLIYIDYHCAIYGPLLYSSKFTIRVACVYIEVGWAVPTAYISALLYTKVIAEELGHFFQDMPCVGSCQLLFNKFCGWLNFPVFFFPCLTFIVLYVKIFTVANKQARLINNMSRSLGSQLHMGAFKSERKAAKTLGVAVEICLLCWLPFTTDILIWFSYFSSACNCLVCVFSYHLFWKAVNLVLTWEIFCSRTSTVDLYQTCTVENIVGYTTAFLINILQCPLRI